MGWLFVARLKPFVMLAAFASLVLNLALLMPTLFMVQVFDRVFVSRSLETLAMLSLLVLLALALAWFMDLVRARALAQAAESVDGLLAPAALARALQRAAGPERSSEPEALRDVAQLRNFLGSSGVLALFDAPWLPLHLLVITLMHPLLGVAATLGASGLVLLAVLTERLTRERTHTLQQRQRATSRRSHSLLRHAEVIAGMGMAAAAVSGWSRQHQSARDAQAELARRSTLLAATARIARQALQVALLAVGAWLVVGADASAGIMVAATILLGRALMPVEQ
ncbi:MAG TPA: type I secretion system permease/ATPase, partial [Burkholderiaceae bacterium]